MTVPLALFLTNFSAPPPPPEMLDLAFDPIAVVETDMEPASDLAAQIESAVDAAKLEAQERHTEELLALRQSQERDLAEAVAAARAEWVASTSAALTSNVDTAISALRDKLSDAFAAVLRPLLADTLRERVSRELTEALDRLLVDSTQPLLRVRGPEDLCAALHAARPSVEIDWVIDESTDVELIAGSTHIETKLAAALADITATEN